MIKKIVKISPMEKEKKLYQLEWEGGGKVLMDNADLNHRFGYNIGTRISEMYEGGATEQYSLVLVTNAQLNQLEQISKE